MDGVYFAIIQFTYNRNFFFFFQIKFGTPISIQNFKSSSIVYFHLFIDNS